MFVRETHLRFLSGRPGRGDRPPALAPGDAARSLSEAAGDHIWSPARPIPSYMIDRETHDLFDLREQHRGAQAFDARDLAVDNRD